MHCSPLICDMLLESKTAWNTTDVVVFISMISLPVSLFLLSPAWPHIVWGRIKVILALAQDLREGTWALRPTYLSVHLLASTNNLCFLLWISGTNILKRKSKTQDLNSVSVHRLLKFQSLGLRGKQWQHFYCRCQHFSGLFESCWVGCYEVCSARIITREREMER